MPDRHAIQRRTQRALLASLLDAYRAGAFPMADPETGEVALYTTAHRGVFPLEPGAFHLPRRLVRRLRQARLTIRSDTDFEGVVRSCAGPRRNEPETWISEALVSMYLLLHRSGHAHSVEAWVESPGQAPPLLVGGIFGVHIGAAFFGESMFHTPPPKAPIADASKVCLAHLVAHLRRRGFTLFDTQLVNPFLERFGCVEIPEADYYDRLDDAINRPVAWAPFEADWRGAHT